MSGPVCIVAREVIRLIANFEEPPKVLVCLIFSERKLFISVSGNHSNMLFYPPDPFYEAGIDCPFYLSLDSFTVAMEPCQPLPCGECRLVTGWAENVTGLSKAQIETLL